LSLSQGDVCLSCPGAVELGILLPHLAGVIVEGIAVAAGFVCVWARARAGEAACPKCGTASGRVHSRYGRRLADVAIGGRRVMIRLTVRRFFCAAPGCKKRTFAEQVEGLTTRYARRTPPLRAALGAVAAALAGRAGSRLAAALNMTAGRTCMLRLLMTLPVPQPGTVRVLGVDDFAFRRGRVYGTILIDVETSRPVDLLPDREADTLRDWLKAHPGTEVVCRDRAGAYADGAREGAPGAVQVADRWHLWHNLAEHAEKTVARHRECIRQTEPEVEAAPEAEASLALQQAAATAAAQQADASPLASRTRERWELIQALRAQGKGIKPIMRETGLARGTVRRFYHAATVDELLAKARDGRPTQLDDHKDYLHQRWNQGCTSVRQLHAEIRERGYPGSYGAVRDYLRPFRELGAAPPAAPAPPKARDITRWLLSQPGSLDEDEKLKLKDARDRCPHVDALASHVTAFAEILTGRHGGRLDEWIVAVEADDQPDLHSFTHGIKRDYDAVKNGLTLQWSSGAVEGNVNRLKVLKRQMYGHAGFDLLRHRALLAT
jgi:transposase